MRLLGVCAAIGLAAALAACGGSDGKEPARDPAEAFRQRAGEICTDVNDRIVAMEGRIREKTRTERDPAAVTVLDASVFTRYERFIGELVRRLGQLEGAAPDPAALRDYLARLRRLGRASKATGESWSSPHGVADLDSIGPAVEKAEAAAERLRLAPCAELSNPALTGSA